jgi:hypothetical protein
LNVGFTPTLSFCSNESRSRQLTRVLANYPCAWPGMKTLPNYVTRVYRKLYVWVEWVLSRLMPPLRFIAVKW